MKHFIEEKITGLNIIPFCLIFDHFRDLLHIEISLLLCVIWLFVSQKIRKRLCKQQPQHSTTSKNTRRSTQRNKVLVASLIGTAIEFFRLFTFTPLRPLLCFRISSSRRAIQRQQRCSRSPPSPSPSSRAPLALPFLVILAIALGVKATLVASLLTMGISTVVIGLLPGYATIGIFALLLLALARIWSGSGL